jgi:sulfite exporter TauE/SafE
LITVLFVTGLLGSLGHCLGMCGPLVLMVGSQFGEITWFAVLPRYLLYHASRITVYAILGTILGFLGSLLGLGGRLSLIGGAVSLVIGVGVTLLGLGYLGWLPLGRIEGTGAWVSRKMKQALKKGGLVGLASLGALNGLLPCGLVYSALLASIAAGSPLKSALSMAAFGAGTIPVLVILGLGGRAISSRIRRVMSRLAGGLIVLVGVQLILRGSAALGWIGHLKIGGFMVF